MKSKSARREHVWARSLLSISSKPSLRQRYSRAIAFGVVTTRERLDEVNAATDKVEQNILWTIAAIPASRESGSGHSRRFGDVRDESAYPLTAARKQTFEKRRS